MKKYVKVMSLLTAMVFAISTLLAGCSGKGKEPAAAGQSQEQTAQTAASGPEANTFPIVSKPMKITWYSSNFSGGELKDFGEIEAFQELQKRSGITIEFQHPPIGGNDNEQLNLIIASNQLPDIIHWNWAGLPGGITKYISGKTIIKLNENVDKYAPNYKKALEKYPDCKKYAALDDGTIPAFYQLDPDQRRLAYQGFTVRGDWLEKLNLKAPVTVEDWYAMLKAFKEKDPNGNGKADEMPWSEQKSTTPLTSFTAAWGILDGMYKDPKDGKIKYGPAQPAYKDFVTTMVKWYKEGLIDSEFASNDAKMFTAKLQGDTVGASYMAVGGGIGNNIKAARVKLPKFQLIGLEAPVGPAGKSYNHRPDFVMKVGWASAITNACKNTREVTKLIDYLYGDEGQALINWGIEGKSYTVENGKKKFVDAVLNNPQGKTPAQAAIHYALPINGWTKVMEFEAYGMINLILPEQQKAADAWSKPDNSLIIPPSIQYTPEESSNLSLIMNEIDTYKNEMLLKFIMGVEPLSKYEDFAKKLKDMRVEEAVKISQASYDRFNTRK